MYYVLLDSTGNLIETYASEAEARDALSEIAAAEPDAAEDVAMIAYDGEGRPVGPAVTSHDPVVLAPSMGEQAAQPTFAKITGRVIVEVGGTRAPVPDEPANDARAATLVAV